MRNPPDERLERLSKGHPQPLHEGVEGGSEREDEAPSSSPPRLRGGAGGGPSSSHAPERTCILTRAHGARDDLIRLAISPDGEVLPDVRARAPGRGAWIGVGRAALETAQAKGKLKGALARAFKGAALIIPADLGERVETALRQAALDRLGLEARAGALLTGSEKIETAARRGEVHLLLHAEDAGSDGAGKLQQALRVGSESAAEPGLVIPAGRAILSMALGRQNVVHIALIDRAAAARVRHALARWRAFIGPDEGLRAAAAASANASPAAEETRRIL